MWECIFLWLFWGRQPICGYLTKFFDPLSVLFLNFLFYTDVPKKGRLNSEIRLLLQFFFVGSVCKDALCVCANIYYYYRYIYILDMIMSQHSSIPPPPSPLPPPSPPPPQPKADCFVSKYTHIRHGSAVY
jgi:hypothetical protein